MAKDVLKLHGCRWNAKDSSRVRDSRTDCGAQLACFANLEKHLLNHARDAYNQEMDSWECHFANCPTNFNFDSEDHLKDHLITSHLQRMFLVCPVAGCDEVTNKWYKLCNHVQTQHHNLNATTKLKPTFQSQPKVTSALQPALPALPQGKYPTYALLENQICPADLLFLPSSPPLLCTVPTRKCRNQLGYSATSIDAGNLRDPYGSTLDSHCYKTSQAASAALHSNKWSSMNATNSDCPVIKVEVKKRLEGTSLIGAPFPGELHIQSGHQGSKHRSPRGDIMADVQGAAQGSATSTAYPFPPPVPATTSTIGFAQLWHRWRTSDEGLAHGPEVEHQWQEKEKEWRRKKGLLVQGDHLGMKGSGRPTAIKRTAPSPPKAVARKTVASSPASVVTLKRKRRILSDSEDEGGVVH
ncbi:hypothetical protein FS837_003975 [Tulasnella sp. UAMH 9824]|nr:hypothetical protein FS837_003975 [Tulasnella sp. UAMH 9824]